MKKGRFNLVGMKTQGIFQKGNSEIEELIIKALRHRIETGQEPCFDFTTRRIRQLYVEAAGKLGLIKPTNQKATKRRTTQNGTR